MSESRTAIRAHLPALAGPSRGQRGVAIILVAILGVILIGFVGLAMDLAYIRTAHQALQRAADAGALAAARVVKADLAADGPTTQFQWTRDEAIAIAFANDAAATAVEVHPNPDNDEDGDIVIGRWDALSQTFAPDLVTPNAVRVRARRTEAPDHHGPISLFFGRAFGTDIANVQTTATAVLAPAQGALILILDPFMQGSLLLNGTVDMVVNGLIHVNSEHTCGIRLNGSVPKVQAPAVSVVGGACYPDGTIQGGAVTEGADPVPDPLADVLPDTAAWNAFKAGLTLQPGSDGLGAITAAGTYPPGYYPGGMQLSSSDTVILDPSSNPGAPYYMFGGNGVTLHGSSFVTGDGVTLFIDKNAQVDISGSGAGAELSAPGGGEFQGVAFFHHRENGPDFGVPDPQSKITGGGLFKVKGLIYIPGGELILGGNPGKEIGAIIVNSMKNAGVTGFTITGDGIPPPEGEEYTFLVE